jgi:uncharacterized protein YjeT (DUF2065 family)
MTRAPPRRREERRSVATATILTLHLAVLIGLYMIAVGIGGLTGNARWAELVEELERSPSLLWLVGAFAFAVGALVVTIHNRWTDPLAMIVTFAGWAALAEGLVLLAYPAAWLALARPMLRHVRAVAIASILLGALFLLAGLTGRADPVIYV